MIAIFVYFALVFWSKKTDCIYQWYDIKYVICYFHQYRDYPISFFVLAAASLGNQLWADAHTLTGAEFRPEGPSLYTDNTLASSCSSSYLTLVPQEPSSNPHVCKASSQQRTAQIMELWATSVEIWTFSTPLPDFSQLNCAMFLGVKTETNASHLYEASNGESNWSAHRLNWKHRSKYLLTDWSLASNRPKQNCKTIADIFLFKFHLTSEIVFTQLKPNR